MGCTSDVKNAVLDRRSYEGPEKNLSATVDWMDSASQ